MSFTAESQEPPSIEIEGRTVALAVRRSPRAERLALRVDPAAPADSPVELVLPRGVALADGLRFARERRDWVARRLAALPPHTPFADGAAFAVAGEQLVIRYVGGRAFTRSEGGRLLVSGDPAHTSRRVRDWLKSRARAALADRSHAVAAKIGRAVGRVRLGDTRSRWGSCSARGDLAYSWRLILAPEFVLDYVVAHEVAHLVHRNHGPRFWRLTTQLCGDVDTPRAWLNRHGAQLLRYG